MARVLGETARYVMEQSIKKFQRQFLAIILATSLLVFVIGFLLGLSLNKPSFSWFMILFFIIVIAVVILTIRLTGRITDKLERKRIDFRTGATGAALVGFILEGFPDAYVVIHGLKPKRRSGDIDHIVIGPTGVYAIDTKNWKGIVTADDQGELLLNGRPTQKSAIRDLTRTIMSIKKKIKVLSSLDPYVHGVLAFPAARVEARWGSTGSVHCMGDDQLYRHIVENKKGETLSKKDIESISQAFLAVARKDKDLAPAGR